ncbi:MAG: NAD(P)/FAD-dependent oxidoreductase [Nitrososphaerales archaeon]|nr:NAD(P)/FAD-dependent oxidoreductase [Nitrososphaerales archaeon]
MVKRLVVLGAGTGGTLLANLLSSRLHDRIRSGEIEVLLLGDGFRHYFQPANLDIAFKGVPPDSESRNESDLLKPGVTFVPDPAAKVDLANRRITTAGGTTYGYDFLVMAPGAEAAPEMMPGLKEGSLNFHTGPWGAEMVWDAVRNFKKGKVVVAIAGVPYKCPPSPDEALFLLEEHFKKRGVKEDVELTLLTPYPRSYPAEKTAKIVGPLLEERNIKVVPFFNMESVDPTKKRVYSLEGEEIPYDLLISVPPHRGTRVVRDSGIGDQEGWIPTDRRNLRIKGHDDAFAIGDATDIPVSKSGVVAHLESKVVANNLIAAMDGEPIEYAYNGRINCPMELGHHRAIFVSATYESPPTPQSPSLVKYAMKRGFASIYWSTLSGSLEWLMDAYFGETSKKVEMSRPMPASQV